jgi:hypothetical protein
MIHRHAASIRASASTAASKWDPNLAESSKPVYVVRNIPRAPVTTGDWHSPHWDGVEFLSVNHFCPESSDHRPITQVKASVDDEALYLIFRVDDRYVRCVRSEYQSEVWKDSCVECFLQPKIGRGYFNMEINCGGTLRMSFIEDPTRVNGVVKTSTFVSPEDAKRVSIFHSLPHIIEKEIPRTIRWTIECRIPIEVMERYVGEIASSCGTEWRANFYKCAEESSHPHWASWSPVKELNFHRPADFGVLRF